MREKESKREEQDSYGKADVSLQIRTLDLGCSGSTSKVRSLIRPAASLTSLAEIACTDRREDAEDFLIRHEERVL